MEEQKDVLGRLEAAVEKKLQELGEANSRLQRKIFDLHAIFEITRQLNSILELEKLLDAILLVASEQAGSTTAALVITSSNPEELSLWRSRGLNITEEFSPISSNSYLVETLLRKKRGVSLTELEQILPSASKEVLFLKNLELELCFPLVSRDKIIGILFLGQRSSKGKYQAPDLEFLSTLVNNLAVTVENARLYQSIQTANLEVQKAQVQLAEKEKLAALGELAASLAHEINNPLGIIKNYLTLLQQESQKKEEFKPTDVASVLNESIGLLATDLEERQITLERKIDGPAAVISAREEELKQVFLNLLMNSRDFTPPGGKINVSLTQRNGSLEIEFTDSGVGIPESDLTKIFVPFFTTKERGKGTGLGLSICRRIIQEHQGSIEARNLKGGGASFLIRLPLN